MLETLFEMNAKLDRNVKPVFFNWFEIKTDIEQYSQK